MAARNLQGEELLSGAPVALPDLLEAREQRAARGEWFVSEGGVIVSMSVVMPGAVKSCELSRRVGAAAEAALETAFPGAERLFSASTVAGPEAFFRLAGDPAEVKRATIAIEDAHPWGRLFDLDVHTSAGALSREKIGVLPRRCLICSQPAKVCGRAKTHPAQALRAALLGIFLSCEAPS
jgi:holo-ACP synthase